jgi:hypothetical protein
MSYLGGRGIGEKRELILISRRPLETGLQIKKKKTSGTNLIKFEFFKEKMNRLIFGIFFW